MYIKQCSGMQGPCDQLTGGFISLPYICHRHENGFRKETM